MLKVVHNGQVSFGKLVLIGTPIGDINDAPAKLAQTLESVDVIAAEDTRRFNNLTVKLGVEITAKIVSYFEGNEAGRTPQLVDDLLAGKTVALITDAGMPSVSDPGYRLVRAAIENQIKVTAVPGPSAALTALAVSGLPVKRFCFEGFLPRKPGPRKKALAGLAKEQRTMIFFEAPHRLADFLTDCAKELGGARPAVVCRELTKTYEEIVRGSLSELAEWAQTGARGECTIVIQGAEKTDQDQADQLSDAAQMVADLIASGEKLSSAVAKVAEASQVNRKQLYQLAVEHKNATK